MLFYEDSKIQILNGHVITELQGLAPESAHMSVLSPPYWGLRNYDLVPQVWSCECDVDHSEGCEHIWQPSLEPGGQGDGISFRRDKKAGRKRGGHQPGFCQKCNAWRGSLGLEPTPDLYIQHIVQVFREIWRVLRSDGVVFLNLGDSYWGGKGQSGHGNPEFQQERFDKGISFNVPASHVAGQGKTRPQDGKHPTLKPKDLCGIPWRVFIALQADGWWGRRDIVWYKPNPMPESCTDRPTTSHEYIFLLTKSGTAKFWTHRDLAGTRTRPKADYRWVNQITDEEVAAAPPDWKEKIICPNCQGTGMAMVDLSCEVMGQWMESWVKDKCPVCEGKKKVRKWKRINLWRGHDYFYDADAVREPHKRLWDESNKGNLAHPTGKALEQGSGFCHHGDYPLPNPAGRNLRSVWTIATQPFPDAHFATFPEKLVEPCIKAGTSEKGCCPECGAPWVRVVEKKQVKEARPQGKSHAIMDVPGTPTYRGGSRNDGLGAEFESKTIGWKPSCGCAEPYPTIGQPIPCTVLDPFGGSGRTAIVAKKLGRKCIIIELKGEYCEMPLDELRQERIF